MRVVLSDFVRERPTKRFGALNDSQEQQGDSMNTSRLLGASIETAAPRAHSAQALKWAMRAALVSATSLASGTVLAQSAEPGTATAGNAQTQQLETVVVTGTSIRGVAPVGSSLVSVGEVDLEKTAATNLSTLVNTIPALSPNGSLALGENLWSFYAPQIHQLGGSS